MNQPKVTRHRERHETRIAYMTGLLMACRYLADHPRDDELRKTAAQWHEEFIRRAYESEGFQVPSLRPLLAQFAS